MIKSVHVINHNLYDQSDPDRCMLWLISYTKKYDSNRFLQNAPPGKFAST